MSHLARERKGMMSYKRAPENSKFWKCEWMHCENGVGLAANGMCVARGEWDNKNCPKFLKATCEHGVLYDVECHKCQKKNKEIWDKWDKQEQADVIRKVRRTQLQNGQRKLGVRIYVPTEKEVRLLLTEAGKHWEGHMKGKEGIKNPYRTNKMAFLAREVVKLIGYF